MQHSVPYSIAIYEKAMPSDLKFEQMLDCAARNGFDRLEISIDETELRLSRLDWNDAQKQALHKAAQRAGIPIRTMCLSGHRKYPFGAHDAAVRERSLEIMKKAVDFAAQTGISIIQLAGYDVYYESGDEQTRGWFVENLQRAVEFAAASGVVLAFETMETPFMDTVAKAMSYVRKVNSPWLGIYPDIGNLQNAAVLYGHDVTDDLASGTGHIFAMHLKETKPGVYRDMAFGTGRTPYDACLRIAKQQGVRMFTGEFWHQPDETDYETMIAAAAAFLRGHLDRVYRS